jgi:hypothetical protein
MLATAAADMNAKLALQRFKTALEGANNAGGDARGVPIHAHDRAKGLEPEGMRETAQEFIAAVVMHDGLADNGPKCRHAPAQPGGHASAVEGKICATCASCHGVPDSPP